MFFDAAMLARAAREIERNLLGARVREIHQPHHDEVCLVPGRDVAGNGVLMSCSPEFGRVCLGPLPPERRQPQPFGLALRKHLRGARLRGVCQPQFDRVLRLEFEECQGFGRESRRSLIVEIMGKHGNMLLLDENGVIVSCAKHVPARMNRYRQIMEGEAYVPPPDFGKLDPRTATADALGERAKQDEDAGVRELLFRHCLGTSKVLTAEVTERVGAWDVVAADLSRDELDRLSAAIRELIEEAGGDGPVFVYERPAGSDVPRRFAYPAALRCCGQPVEEYPHLGAALGPLMARETSERRLRELRQRLEGAATARLRELDRRQAKLRRQLEEAEEAEQWRQLGELLLSQQQGVPGHAAEAELVDYFSEDTPTISVRLDRPGDVRGTAQRLFGRYKRAGRVLARVPPRLEEAERESEYLESVLAEIEMAEEPEDLEAVGRELTDQGYLRKRQESRRPDRSRGPEAPRPRTQTSSDGYAIYYGTNHLQNDELLRTAAPDDIWLHVRSAPGAHVLIRTGGTPERVPQRTLLEAAQIAARWSRLRTQEAADVDYTRAKYVRKRKGHRPGMVHYTHQKTLTVRVPS